MPGKFQLYTTKGGKFRFRLIAGNGEIIAVASEDYETKAAAKKGIASVQRNAASAPVVDMDAAPAKKAPAKKAAAKKAPAKKAAAGR
jgi:hypothetical protein